MKARRWRLAGAVTGVCTLAVLLVAHAQSPPSAQALARELGGRIAAIVAPTDEIHLAGVDAEGQDAGFAGAVRDETAAALRARGLRLVDRSDHAVAVRILCSRNLRDNVCAAEVHRADGREVVVASRPRDAGGSAAAPVAVLDVRPVFAERTQILDLALVGQRLLVLDVAGLSLQERQGDGWKGVASVPIVPGQPWPRDARGRLHVDGGAVAAFMPGLSCRGTSDPLAVSCVEAQEAWPIGVQNNGLAPGRNHFGGALPFFTAAAVASDGVPGWLLAGVDGKLHSAGGAPPTADGTVELAEGGSAPGDVAGITSGCASGRQVIASLSSEGTPDTDSLGAYRLVNRRLVPITPPVAMPGPITALWDVPGDQMVLVVARNRDSGRYEAFHVGLACIR